MKILLFPHPKDMVPGTRSPEHTSRMLKTIEAWRRLSAIPGNQVQVLCTGNLAQGGLNLAWDMMDELIEIEETIAGSIVVGEQESGDTAECIRLSPKMILEIKPDEIRPVSNRWHLLRIGAYLKHQKLGITIRKEFSQSWGPPIYWLSRAVQEVIMYLASITFDRQGFIATKLAKRH